MNRTICFVFFLAMHTVLCHGAYAQSREWTSKAGSKVTGNIEGQTADSITLRIENRPAPLTVKIDQLADADQKFANALWFDRQDARQYKLVVNHLRSISEHPKTVQRLLIEIHNGIPESPYAGLWAAVALIKGDNEHKRASIVLKEVIRRIEKQRAIDPGRHSMTFASANNNLAVCLIKARKGDSAATRMISAIDARPSVPSAIRANAQLLNEVTSSNSAVITFSGLVRERLMRSLAFAESSGAGTKLDAGWHYSLDFDVPTSSYGAESTDGIDAPRPELELLSQGTGFVIAPGTVITSKRVVETTNYRGPKLVTVIANPTDSHWRSEIVDQVTIEATRSIATGGTMSTATFQNGATSGSSRQVYSNYDYVRSPDGHSGAELATLRVPNMSVAPVQVEKTTPPTGSLGSILGFRRGKRAILQGIGSESGEILDSVNIHGRSDSSNVQFDTSRVTRTSARVLGGNRGGPMIDDRNVVIGIAFDTPTPGSNAAGWIFGASELRRWFYRNVQTASILDPIESIQPEARRRTVELATLPVFCWGLREQTSSSVFSMVSDGSRDAGGLFIRDGWCIACDGKGVVDCPVRGCNKGYVVSGRETTQIGFDNITRRPITGSKPKYQKCSTCNVHGAVKCSHCEDGKI